MTKDINNTGELHCSTSEFGTITHSKADKAEIYINKKCNLFCVEKRNKGFKIIGSDPEEYIVQPIFLNGKGFDYRGYVIDTDEIEIVYVYVFFAIDDIHARKIFLEKYYDEVVSKKA